MILPAVKQCHIASDGDRLVCNLVEFATVHVYFYRFYCGSIDEEMIIGFNFQPDCLSDGLGGGHGDDTFGEEEGGGEERAEEDEEPDA